MAFKVCGVHACRLHPAGSVEGGGGVKAYLTGGSGFVGAHVLRVFAAHGVDLLAPRHAEVDVTDARAVRDSVVAFEPDAVVHCAILNDLGRLYADRRAGWEAYVGATRNLVDAANEADARMLLVSTDWVFDGTQRGATEDTPPNPINLYGFLKAASELVVTERARRGSVARIAAVQGSPPGTASPEDVPDGGVSLSAADGGASSGTAGGGASSGTAAGGGTSRTAEGGASSPRTEGASSGGGGDGALPREQDAGFGYFVAALVQRLRNGERFGVWESDRINMVATPTLASEAAELMWRILDRDLDGIFHCCGGESVDRRTLAMRAAQIFELDPTLLDFRVEPPPEALAVPASTGATPSAVEPPPEALAVPASAGATSSGTAWASERSSGAGSGAGWSGTTSAGGPPSPDTSAGERSSRAASARAHARTASAGAAAAGWVPIAIPYDTSLDATRTAAMLDAELPDVTSMLRRMRRELTPV